MNKIRGITFKLYFNQVQCNLHKWGAWDGLNLNCPPFNGYNFQLDKHYTWSYYTIRALRSRSLCDDTQPLRGLALPIITFGS